MPDHSDPALTLHKLSSNSSLPQDQGQEDLGSRRAKGQTVDFTLKFREDSRVMLSLTVLATTNTIGQPVSVTRAYN